MTFEQLMQALLEKGAYVTINLTPIPDEWVPKHYTGRIWKQTTFANGSSSQEFQTEAESIEELTASLEGFLVAL